MSINERVVSALKEKGLTQKELSAFIQVSSSTLNNWLKKNNDIPAQYIIPISEFLEENPLYILGETKASTSKLSEDAENLALRWDSLDDDGKALVRAELIKAEDRIKSGNTN